ncbi:hypothetical protein FHX15_004633 [Rhizobium sp. BK650]|nr:hypothetical protein [Rhizobium sp. BK650]
MGFAHFNRCFALGLLGAGATAGVFWVREACMFLENRIGRDAY